MEKLMDYREGMDVAIIGMVGRFPGAENIDEFYQNLKEGKNTVSYFTKEELIENGIPKEDIEKSNYIKAKGVIETAESFDNKFFGYTPSEAKVMDPQMRLMHECVWQALENAGYSPETFNRLIGVYVGGTPNPLWETLTFLDEENNVLNPFSKSILNDKDLMATRVSYKLNLKGPSMAFFTSCSTSLVAIHTAVQALLNGECDIAVAGGVSATYPNKQGYEYQEGMHLSPDGCCRSFDAKANGLVISDAIGLVVLKRVEDAVDAGDTIDALIIGSAINNDGNRKVGYTAPSVEGQEDVMRIAQSLAEIKPQDIAYIETHGSGTRLGDNIEIEALKRVFHKSECAKLTIGTAKTNIGHTNSAAGAVGVIKTVLGLKHKEVFPHINFEMPHPELELEDSPFHIVTKLETLSNEGKPLIAGVSSFGVGGTNAHVILKEAPKLKEVKDFSNEEQIIVLSAQTVTALEAQKENLRVFLKKNKKYSIKDLAYTLQVGRTEFNHRCAFAADGIEKIVTILNDTNPRGVWQNEVLEKPKYVWMFAGQGKQYFNMGRELYDHEPYFREEINRCLELARSIGGINYKKYLYGDTLEDTESIISTDIVQPMMFCFEYALAKFFMELDVPVNYLIGYSFGEITAACLAGVVELKDAIRMVVIRGKLMKQGVAGSMLSVPLPDAEVKNLINDNISIAIDNGETCIVSGLKEDINEFQERLKNMKILSIPIKGEHVAHSFLLKDIADAFEEVMNGIQLSAPKIPIISCITGKILSNSEATDMKYWSSHMLRTIKFYNGIKDFKDKSKYVFLEFGPGRDLSNIVQRCRNQESTTIDLVRGNSSITSDMNMLMNRIACLWTLGTKFQWDKLHTSGKGKRIHLPTYPFERQAYPFHKSIADIRSNKSVIKTHRNSNMSEWFYVQYWKHSILEVDRKKTKEQSLTWLVLSDSSTILKNIKEKLYQQGDVVIHIESGSEYKCIDNNHYVIDLNNSDDFYRVVSSLIAKKIIIDRVIDLFPVEEGLLQELLHIETCKNTQQIEKAQLRGMYSIIRLLKAFVQEGMTNEMKLMIITDSMNSITGSEDINPNYATLVGLVKVINQEFVNIQCSNIDIEMKNLKEQEKIVLAEHLIREFNSRLGISEVAYRGKYRWVKGYENHPIEVENHRKYGIKQGGTYVIIGGFGKIGFEVAKYLMKTYSTQIAIITRSEIAESEQFARENQISEKEISKVGKIEMLRKLGNVIVEVADVANLSLMEEAFEHIEQKLGKVNGVIHVAGVTGIKTSKAVTELTLHDCMLQFNAKVFGLYVLEQVLADKEIDFCMLFSSLSPILGGLGYGAYAAASSFMDAFNYYHNLTSEQQWIDVNWETWLNEGFIDTAMYALGSYNAQMTLSVEEAMQVFERILAWVDFDKVVVSSGVLEQRLKRWINLESIEQVDKITNEMIQNFQMRPQLVNEYVAPSTKTEEILCETWNKILGMADIGVQDNFFELGGDSLKLLNTVGVIYKEFNVDIPVSEFFNNATIEYLAKRIDCSTKIKKATIQPAKMKEYYSVSSAQKRIYYLQQMNMNSTTYNETTVFTLEGKVNVQKIKKVFKQLVARHEILRTSIIMVNNEPVQIIHDNVEFYVDYMEVQDAKAAINQCVKPFDLSNAPLIRVALIKVEAEKYVMILDMSHIITDGVSEGILIHEFMTLYQGDKLEPIEIQYKDYAEWQLEQTRQNELGKHEEYWCDKYKDGIPKLDFPYDHSRPMYKTFAGNSIGFTLDEKMTAKLKELAKNESITMYILLLSAYSIFMNKLCNVEDVVIGTNSAGRVQPEIQNVLGIFVNTLALRLKPESNKTIKEFLQDVKNETLEGFENQDFQFDDLVDKLVRVRDFSRNPIFDVSFVWQNMEYIDIVIDDVRFIPYQHNDNSAKFDLTLFGYELNSELFFKIEYNTDLFEESTIHRFIGYYRNIISAILMNIFGKIEDINVLTHTEIQQLLSYNNNLKNFQREKTIVTVFEEQVTKVPEKIALVCGEIEVTYQELNNQANQLANYLLKQGVERDSVIGIIFDRTIDMIVGILGVLKAGCGYMPIDPTYPASRIQYILKDSETKLVIISEKYVNLVEGIDLNIVSYELVYKNLPCENPVIKIQPTNLAYIIYTSGTTGNPKGVMIEHRNVINLVLNDYTTYEFSNEDVWTLFHSYCFDFSVWEMYGALLTGAKLVIVPKETTQSPNEFLKVLTEQQVTVLNQTPTAFENLLKTEKIFSNAELKLRYVIFGGEALKPTVLKEFKEVYPAVKLINMYGITETTVHVTMKELALEDMILNISNIGTAIPGYKIYVMNTFGQLAPIGVIGELYVGGEGVTRGYLHKPELTKQRLLKDPFSQDGRIYKSGDLARWLPSGELEYIGRADYQVKIRGHRIELGEVEARLLDCKKIIAARVIVRNDVNQMDSICAYVVSKEELDVSEIRAELRNYLPDYMLPPFFIQLKELPLTSNGKVDIKSLPKPKIITKRQQVKPANEIEAVLVHIWSEVFGVAELEVSVEHNLFEIGGNSINIIRIQDKLEQSYGIDIPIAVFFQYTTIRTMAAYIQELLNRSQINLSEEHNLVADMSDSLIKGKSRLRIRNNLARED